MESHSTKWTQLGPRSGRTRSMHVHPAPSALVFPLFLAVSLAAPHVRAAPPDDEPSLVPFAERRDVDPHELWQDRPSGSLWFALAATFVHRPRGEHEAGAMLLLSVPLDRTAHVGSRSKDWLTPDFRASEGEPWLHEQPQAASASPLGILPPSPSNRAANAEPRPSPRAATTDPRTPLDRAATAQPRPSSERAVNAAPARPQSGTMPAPTASPAGVASAPDEPRTASPLGVGGAASGQDGPPLGHGEEGIRLPIPVVVTPQIARAAVNAALRSAHLEAPEQRLDALASRARASALLPELRVRATRLVDEAQNLSPTEYDSARTTASGGESIWLEARATWRLDRLVFADEEIALERLRNDRAEAQTKVTARTLELLFTWQRATAQEADTAKSPEDHLTAALKVIECEASLDVITGGWFTKWRPQTQK